MRRHYSNVWERLEVARWELHRRVTCRAFGHRFTIRKLSGDLCRRCYIFRSA